MKIMRTESTCTSDTGTGFPPDILEAIEQDTPIYYNDRKHIGIQNSLKRLKLIYGEKAKINFSNMDEGYGAVVEITIPVQKEQNTGTNKDRV